MTFLPLISSTCLPSFLIHFSFFFTLLLIFFMTHLPSSLTHLPSLQFIFPLQPAFSLFNSSSLFYNPLPSSLTCLSFSFTLLPTFPSLLLSSTLSFPFLSPLLKNFYRWAECRLKGQIILLNLLTGNRSR
jgi:hypothetical protein